VLTSDGHTYSGADNNGGCWPTAATTGVPAGTTLLVHFGDQNITTAGQVIDGWDITGHLDIRAANVTVRNSRIRCNSSGECEHTYSTGLHMSRVEIGPDSGYAGIAVMDGNTSSTRNVYDGLNIHNAGDGLRCDGGVELTNSWVHMLGFGGGLHGDACQAGDTDSNPDPGNLLFRHNVMEGGNTSCFIIQGNPAGIRIDHNLLLGISLSGEQTSYAFNIGPGVPANGVIVSNNVLSVWSTWQSGFDGSSLHTWLASEWFGNVDTNGAVAPKP
jgi:hypothetical protein